MYIKEVTVQNKVGLHALPASDFTRLARSFDSSIWVENGVTSISAKSLVGVLTLGIMKDAHIRIIANGQDEVNAVDALVYFVESGCSNDALLEALARFKEGRTE